MSMRKPDSSNWNPIAIILSAFENGKFKKEFDQDDRKMDDLARLSFKKGNFIMVVLSKYTSLMWNKTVYLTMDLLKVSVPFIDY